MSGITAILTAYRRPNTIQPLVEAIRTQTIPRSRIWIWANEPTVLGTNGEDIELAARAMRFGDIPCYCPPHPPNDRSLSGSTRGDELGSDEQATFRRATHVAERDQIVRAEIAAGWRPLFMRGDVPSTPRSGHRRRSFRGRDCIGGTVL